MNPKNLIESYIEGWKTSDAIKILSPLAANCLIIESHGPIYHGKEMIQEWVLTWLKCHKVKKWELTSFYSFNDIICCEWNFSYQGKEGQEEFKGITIARIEHEKIIWLKEYRMTAPPYPWNSH